MAREEAVPRPVGLAEGPDGSLYIVDSVNGKIWRVISQRRGVS
jgi:glucose/arabinose dehydrogenase